MSRERTVGSGVEAELARHTGVEIHGNSIRALVKYFDHVSDEEITELNIPTGIPRVYELDSDLSILSDRYLADEEAVKAAAAAVAAQGRA